MKVYRPGTDLNAEFSVFSNGERCLEYLLAGRPTNNNDTEIMKECYVAIDEDAAITVTGHFDGTVLHARFDLTVDGAFVGCRFVEAEKYGNQKTHKGRRIDFKRVTTSITPRPGVVAANGVLEIDMAVNALRKLPDHLYVGDGYSHGVGTIVVYVWAEHKLSNGCEPSEHDFPTSKLDHWTEGDHEVIDSGIEPKHCMTITNANFNVVRQKANKFLAQRTENRYGQQPFAKLVFHYRTKDAILGAGCMPQPAKAYPVPQEKKEASIVMSSDENEARKQADGAPGSLGRSTTHAQQLQNSFGTSQTVSESNSSPPWSFDPAATTPSVAGNRSFEYSDSATSRRDRPGQMITPDNQATFSDDLFQMPGQEGYGAQNLSESPFLPDNSPNPQARVGHRASTGASNQATPQSAPATVPNDTARVVIDGQTVELPSAREIITFIPEEGIRTQMLFRIFPSDLEPHLQDLHQRAIIQHISPWAGIYVDRNGVQFFYLNPVLNHMLSGAGRRERQAERQHPSVHSSGNKRKTPPTSAHLREMKMRHRDEHPYRN